MNPFGFYGAFKDPVQLFHEEYEVIRLLDYERMNQEDAAKQMGVSRPTLTRIYESARTKIAKSFTEARQILIEGGKAYFADEWYECKHCKSRFNMPEKRANISCPVCRTQEVSNFSI